MTHRRPCTCGRHAIPDRVYRMPDEPKRWSCRRCGCLILPGHRRTKPRKLDPPPEFEPEPLDRETVVMMGASVFRALPHLTNTAVYNRLAEETEGLPSIETWTTKGWAADARRMSGTSPVAGRGSEGR